MKRFLRWKRSGLWKNRAGGVLVFFAIAAPVLIGLAGASIDIGLWYANKRLAQSAADAAALAGALELRRTDETDADAIHADVETAVNLDAAINGYSAGNGDTIVVDTSNSPRVAVTIIRPLRGFLSQVVYIEQTNVAARAVARADVNDSCLWSLNPDEGGAVRVSGTGDVTLGCGVIANSSDPGGVATEGTACLTATEIKVVGGTDGGCIDPTAGTGINQFDDPLAALEAPPGPYPCDYTNVTITNVSQSPLQPGTYCGFLRINTTAPIVFDPGLYILDEAELTINGTANVTGTDVSFYLTENSGNNDDISIAGGANVTLSAPSDGPLPGILFYHDRNFSGNPGFTHQMAGGANMILNGIIYFPTTDLAFSGGSALNESASIIIADEVSFTGDAFLGGFSTAPGNILSNALMLQATLLE